MTKKEFVAIQTALAEGYSALLAITGPLSEVLQRNADRCHASTCRAVADVLARQSGKFKRDEFLRGCGVEGGR